MKTIARMLFTTMLTIVGISSTSLPLAAYDYAGFKWSGNSVYYTEDLPSDFALGIIYAKTTWNNSPADLNFYYTSSSNNTWATRNLGNTGGLAVTYISYSGQTILEVDVEFNTYYQWSLAGGNGAYSTTAVALHELGHWLCLNDLYSWLWDRNKVMYYQYNGRTTLHQDDINGIVYIYGS